MKKFVFLYSINWSSFIVWLLLLREILGNMYIVFVCKPGCDVMNFEINLIFLIRLFFLHDQKVIIKIWISWEQKELLIWNKKHFLSFSRAFNEENIANFFGRWDSDFKIVWIKITTFFFVNDAFQSYFDLFQVNWLV